MWWELCITVDVNLADGYGLKCKSKRCKTRYSIRTGSWYAMIRLPLDVLLLLMYMWCWRFKSFQIVHELCLSKDTVSDYKNMFREVCFMWFTKTAMKRLVDT
jgi:hypothetical protein